MSSSDHEKQIAATERTPPFSHLSYEDTIDATSAEFETALIFLSTLLAKIK